VTSVDDRLCREDPAPELEKETELPDSWRIICPHPPPSLPVARSLRSDELDGSRLQLSSSRTDAATTECQRRRAESLNAERDATSRSTSVAEHAVLSCRRHRTGLDRIVQVRRSGGPDTSLVVLTSVAAGVELPSCRTFVCGRFGRLT